MKRRTMFGLMAAGALGLVAAGGAAAYGAHGGGRHSMMKRMVVAAIDDALGEAKVTADQRTAIYAARDRAFAALELARTSRRAHVEDGLRLFEADQVDPAQVEAFHRQGDEEGASRSSQPPCRTGASWDAGWSSCCQVGHPTGR